MFRSEAYFFNFYALPNIIVSSLIFATGFFVFWQNRKNPSNIFFFLFCLSLNLWLYGRAIMYCSRDSGTALAWAKIFAKLGVVFIAPLVYTFSVHWLGFYRQQRNYVIAGFLTAAAFYLTILTTPYGLLGVRHYFWGYYPVYGPVCKIFLIFFFTYFIAAFRNFFKAWRTVEDPVRRKQIKIVTIAYLISFTGSVDYLPKVINLPLYPFGYLSVFIWTLILAYSIVRYRVMDIQTVIHKTIMWFLSMVIAIVPFALLIYFSEKWLQRQSVELVTAAVLTLIILFYFYFRALQPQLDHFFQRRQANLYAIANKFSAELVHLKNLRDLLQSTARVLGRSLYVKSVSIYLKNQEESEMEPLIAKRGRGLKPVSLSHPFISPLENCDETLVLDLILANPHLENIKSAAVDYISKTNAVVIVPLVLGGRLTGVIHLGEKSNLKRYTPQEISFLNRLKAPLTIAFSNSLQFIAMEEKLKKWNEELEKKVDERTRELNSTQAQLVQAEKLATIGALAGGVAHEINNPLTAVLTNAQILKMTASDPDDVESLSLIEEGAKRCQAIIQKLMKYARKPMGPAETLSQVDVNKAVENTVAFLKYQLQQENIELKLQKKEDLHPVEGNSNELEQVFTNLILNSKDAIKQTGLPGVIEIKTAEQNGSVQIMVGDNGAGISKENLGKIFDPFFTTKELGKGTGLGLAVTFGIIEKHKGKIEVMSEAGGGTIFTIKLPKVME